VFRTRSRFSRRGRGGDPRTRIYLLAGVGVLLIAAFIALVRMGDGAAPARQEIRIELPDAFKTP
jgi:hypothetical protein